MVLLNKTELNFFICFPKRRLCAKVSGWLRPENGHVCWSFGGPEGKGDVVVKVGWGVARDQDVLGDTLGRPPVGDGVDVSKDDD